MLSQTGSVWDQVDTQGYGVNIDVLLSLPRPDLPVGVLVPGPALLKLLPRDIQRDSFYELLP